MFGEVPCRIPHPHSLIYAIQLNDQEQSHKIRILQAFLNASQDDEIEKPKKQGQHQLQMPKKEAWSYKE